MGYMGERIILDGPRQEGEEKRLESLTADAGTLFSGEWKNLLKKFI